MTFAGIFNTLMLLGTLQGGIMSYLLLFSKKRSAANRLLGTLILLLTLACLNMYLLQASLVKSDGLLSFALNFIPLIIIMPVGPLLYFYVKSSLDPGFRLTKKHRLHFYPVLIDLVPYLTAAVFVIGVQVGLIVNKPEPWVIFIDTYNVYSDIPRWASLTVYLWLSARYLGSLKTAQERHRKWMRGFIRLFLIFQTIWLMHLIPYVIPQFYDKLLDAVDWYPVYIPVVVLVYWLGIKGYMMAPVEEAPALKAKPKPLPDAMVNQALPILKTAMEQDHLYLNPNLNLTMLSQHTGLAPKTVSAVLNQHLMKSFTEFVNQYRIDFFKQKIRKQELEHLTILGIALESGFNSQATFQRAFKNSTGMSPREYVQQHRVKPVKTEK